MLTGKKGRGDGGIRKIFAGNFIPASGIPPTFRMFEHNALQRGTAGERSTANLCHTLGNDNALKSEVPLKLCTI